MSSHSGRKHRATRVKLKKHPKIHLPPNLQTIRQALQSQPSENTRKHEKTRKSARKHEKLHVHTGIPSVTSVRFWISRSYSGFSSIMMAYASPFSIISFAASSQSMSSSLASAPRAVLAAAATSGLSALDIVATKHSPESTVNFAPARSDFRIQVPIAGLSGM